MSDIRAIECEQEERRNESIYNHELSKRRES